LLALSNSSSIFGLGVFQSVSKYGHLPFYLTDFIFPIIVEELGIIGISIVFGSYYMMCRIIYKMALRSRIKYYKYVYIGVIAYLIIHFVLNVGGVSGLIPLTGVPLMLFSKGGSSMLSVLVLMGICQKLYILEKKNARS
ncbi:MAG: FtsW/RodA/SpoVE family cell cycle protein, partial [Erysipelotrichaceae bacterium]